MKEKRRAFLHSFYITLVVSLCIIAGFCGAVKAYENTVYVCYGKEKSAFEITDDGIRIFDFVIFTPNSETKRI